MRLRQVQPVDRGRRSRKYILESKRDGVIIEAAYVDFGHDAVVCASAQAGCAIGCRHCATTHSEIPYHRDLTAEEIIACAELIIEDTGNHPLDVLDFSGIGDCSANWQQVRAACEALLQQNRILRYTVTTIAPQLWCQRLLAELSAGVTHVERMAVSLHGVDVDTRRLLIPKAEDPQSLGSYLQQLHAAGCRIVLNYVVHAGNCSKTHADALVEYVNAGAQWIDTLRLCPLNYVPGAGVEGGDVASFAEDIMPSISGTKAVVFEPIGSENAIACGQMRASVVAAEAATSSPAGSPPPGGKRLRNH